MITTLKALPVNLSKYLKVSKTVLWFFLVPGLVIFSLHAGLSIAHPYSLDYGEAPLINQAMRLAQGEPIYRSDLSTPPYIVANYPPLYVLSLVPFLNLFDSPFHIGRIISMVAALVSATALGLTSFHFSKNRLVAITTGIFFLSFPYVVEWSSRARIDCLALAFATSALYFFARWPQRRWSFFVGGALLVAAAYTRQSYALAAPLAAFVWLWSQDKRRALLLALYVAGLGAAIFLALNAFTKGGFYDNIVTANINEFGWQRLQENLDRLWQDANVILVLAALYLILGWKNGKGWALFAPFLVGASLSALTIGKIGSNINYFLELAAALSLAAGAILAWSQKHPWRNTLAILLVTIQFGLLFQSTMEVQVDWILASRRGDFNALQFLEQEVLDMEGPVPADEYMGMLTMNDRPLYIQPFEVSQMVRQGTWDQGPFLASIRQQTFEGILIHHFGTFPVHRERWTPEMLEAIERNYRPVKTLAGTVIFTPQRETSIKPVSTPLEKPTFDPVEMVVGPQRVVGRGSYWSQPDIAANQNQPGHLAVIATQTSQPDCQLPNCKIALNLYTSLDGGESWQGTQAFSGAQNIFYDGLVDFDRQDNLYAFGTRDRTLVLNYTNLQDGYTMSRAHLAEITSAQVIARSWFRLHPQDGQVYVSLDAQESDMLFVAPSLLRSQTMGTSWTNLSRADQHISINDMNTSRASWPEDIQVLFGNGSNVSLVWTWSWEPWNWPRTVWMANSSDGGDTFGEPTPILETWGPINTTSENGRYAIAYRVGDFKSQKLAVATSDDNGTTWSSAVASGDLDLNFDPDKGPGIGMAPSGTIDLVFYDYDHPDEDCLMDLQAWQATIQWGRVDPCSYNLYYTFSPGPDLVFSRPVQLNDKVISGPSLARFQGRSYPGSHLEVASTDDFAYPVWIGTPADGETQVQTVQISR